MPVVVLTFDYQPVCTPVMFIQRKRPPEGSTVVIARLTPHMQRSPAMHVDGLHFIVPQLKRSLSVAAHINGFIQPVPHIHVVVIMTAILRRPRSPPAATPTTQWQHVASHDFSPCALQLCASSLTRHIADVTRQNSQDKNPHTQHNTSQIHDISASLRRASHAIRANRPTIKLQSI